MSSMEKLATLGKMVRVDEYEIGTLRSRLTPTPSSPPLSTFQLSLVGLIIQLVAFTGYTFQLYLFGFRVSVRD